MNMQQSLFKRGVIVQTARIAWISLGETSCKLEIMHKKGGDYPSPPQENNENIVTPSYQKQNIKGKKSWNF